MFTCVKMCPWSTVCTVVVCGTWHVVGGVGEFRSPRHSEQTWRDHLSTFKRVTVTPAVCPRLFEILTTLTFRALGRSHIVSTAFETIAKKHGDRKGSVSTCDQQFIMNCQEHNRSWMTSVTVLASMRWLLCGENEIPRSMTVRRISVIEHKSHRWAFFSLTFF